MGIKFMHPLPCGVIHVTLFCITHTIQHKLQGLTNPHIVCTAIIIPTAFLLHQIKPGEILQSSFMQNHVSALCVNHLAPSLKCLRLICVTYDGIVRKPPIKVTMHLAATVGTEDIVVWHLFPRIPPSLLCQDCPSEVIQIWKTFIVKVLLGSPAKEIVYITDFRL